MRITAVCRVFPEPYFRVRMCAMCPDQPTFRGYAHCRSHSVASATGKLNGIRRNPAVTRSMENPGKIGVLSEKQRRSIDRRLSVAPMMDDVESRALISENQGLAPRPLGRGSILCPRDETPYEGFVSRPDGDAVCAQGLDFTRRTKSAGQGMGGADPWRSDHRVYSLFLQDSGRSESMACLSRTDSRTLNRSHTKH